MHPAWLRCESLKYLDIPALSRLARQAPQHLKMVIYLCANPKAQIIHPFSNDLEHIRKHFNMIHSTKKKVAPRYHRKLIVSGIHNPTSINKSGMEVLKVITTFPALAGDGFHAQKLLSICPAMTEALRLSFSAYIKYKLYNFNNIYWLLSIYFYCYCSTVLILMEYGH
jgi:hypothetical protein